MQIAFAPPTPPAKGVWVVLAAADGTLGPTAAELDRRAGGSLTRALKDWGGSLKRGETIELRYPAGLEVDRVVLVSLGKTTDASDFDLESVGASLAAKLRTLRIREASIVVEAPGDLNRTPQQLAIDLATGASLRAYRFDKYRTAKEADEEPADEVARLALHLPEPAAAEAAWTRAAAVIAGVTHGRDLVTEPANVLSPEAFAEACRDLGAALGLEVEVHDRAALERMGMRALLGVSQGSIREPRVATLRWSGGAPGQPPVALVGKGVCFDSGGLSLKPAVGHGGDEVGHGRRRRGVRRHEGARRPQGQGECRRRARADREHAIRHRATPGRRGDLDGGRDHRGGQHRRRRAGSSWPTCCTTPRNTSSPRR